MADNGSRDAIAAAIVANAIHEGTFGPFAQGGLPTGRDVFDNTPAEDWGSITDPDNAPTMTAPDMHASPHATPTFDVDKSGMPSAPTFDFNAPSFTPAAPGEGGSLNDPGLGALGALGLSDPGGGLGVGDVGMGGGGLGAVGGTEGVGGMGDPSGGGVG